jgi:hypothetical protein
MTPGTHLGPYEIVAVIGAGGKLSTTSIWFEELRQRVPIR